MFRQTLWICLYMKHFCKKYYWNSATVYMSRSYLHPRLEIALEILLVLKEAANISCLLIYMKFLDRLFSLVLFPGICVWNLQDLDHLDLFCLSV